MGFFWSLDQLFSLACLTQLVTHIRSPVPIHQRLHFVDVDSVIILLLMEGRSNIVNVELHFNLRELNFLTINLHHLELDCKLYQNYKDVSHVTSEVYQYNRFCNCRLLGLNRWCHDIQQSKLLTLPSTHSSRLLSMREARSDPLNALLVKFLSLPLEYKSKN